MFWEGIVMQPSLYRHPTSLVTSHLQVISATALEGAGVTNTLT